MAYDRTPAARIRALLSDRGDVAERPMLGGLTFMVAGHMCCGVNKDELIVRLSPADADAALSNAAVRLAIIGGAGKVPRIAALTCRCHGQSRAINCP